MEIRTADPSSSRIEGPQETNTQNNSNSDSEDESVSEEPNLDKTEQAYDPNASNIIEIRDSLLARKDNIVIFTKMDTRNNATMVHIC